MLKDENCDRFIGRHPLNSRERSIGRGHQNEKCTKTKKMHENQKHPRKPKNEHNLKAKHIQKTRKLDNNMTLVYCGSSASAHSHNPASPSRVSASRPISLHCLFSNHFDNPCTKERDLVGLDQSSWKQSHRTTIRSPAHTRASLPRPGGRYTLKHTTTEPGVCYCGPCISGELSAFRSQWSGTASALL